MPKQLLIKKNVLTTELALLKDNELISYSIESNTETNWQNCIVIGQVQSIVKNLKAVFVDYGADKNGLLHFKQIPNHYLKDMKQGYLLPVQVIKQNDGDKGNKLTAQLNLVGKYLVCLPFEEGLYFSKKITDDIIKKQIKQAIDALEAPYSFIVRTHASQVPIEAIVEDAQNLIQKTSQMIEAGPYLAKGNILYEELSSTYQMVIEQLIKQEPLEIICDHQEVKEKIETFIEAYHCQDTVYLNSLIEEKHLFSIYSLTKKIEQLTKKQIWLKCGGNIIIDYTEAMTVIDVNSAKAILTKNAEKANLELNKEAIKEAILQILRRNLSGIIIVDLVEMKEYAHKQILYDYAKQLLKDYEDSLTKVYPLTELGLLQFSRTKKYHCIKEQLLEKCPTCQMPYAKNSFLAELIKLENQLKGLAKQEMKQPVFLTMSPTLYEKIKKESIIEHLEQQYPIKIEIEKSRLAENQILCQFYER